MKHEINEKPGGNQVFVFRIYLRLNRNQNADLRLGNLE